MSLYFLDGKSVKMLGLCIIWPTDVSQRNWNVCRKDTWVFVWVNLEWKGRALLQIIFVKLGKKINVVVAIWLFQNDPYGDLSLSIYTISIVIISDRPVRWHSGQETERMILWKLWRWFSVKISIARLVNEVHSLHQMRICPYEWIARC